MNFKLDNWKKTVPVAILIIVLSFVLSSFLSSSKKQLPRAKTKTEKEYKKISVVNVKNSLEISATGRVNVYNKVDIYTEVSGVLEKGTKEFRSGNWFKKGDVILNVNSDVTRMNLNAAKGAFIKLIATVLPDIQIDFPVSGKLWEDYLMNFKIEDEIKPLPEIKNPKERLYLAGNNIFNQYYTIKSQEEMLKKYTIRAPFDGILTDAKLKEGTLVRVGQLAGEFINTDKYEIELSVSPDKMFYLEAGQLAQIKIENLNQTISGKVDRINSKIDQSTQTIKVYVSTTDQKLKDGMYVETTILTDYQIESIKIPRKLLVKNNQVFVIENNSLKLKSVELINVEGENVIVKGLTNGETLLGENLPNAFEGMIVN